MTLFVDEHSSARRRMTCLDQPPSVFERLDAKLVAFGGAIWRATIEGLAAYATAQCVPDLDLYPIEVVEDETRNNIRPTLPSNFGICDNIGVTDDHEDPHTVVPAIQNKAVLYG